ncbi:phage tail tube protein [Cupriavidus nantongensis]|uniref:Phage tail protein n=1 Tax=Cupriavidus nantongensis TaxID=1796606 RepID=A0A142JHW9_9BURK|nr:phage tail tube protein [Cupriavidus nantongensis]AMR77681.1 hypothetical protein A2G96_08000 [Cupriavidus nantongensis]
MTIASGVAKKVVISKEAAWGVKPAANTGRYMRRVTAEINLERPTFESNEIRTDYQTADMRLGTKAVNGTLSGELSPETFELIFAAALRAAWVAGETYTGADIAAADAGNRLVKSAGSWLTEGFKIGDLVTVSGFATLSNNGQAVVLGVTATDLSLDKELVTEAEGANVTVAVAGKKLAVPLSGHTNDSFAIEQWYSDILASELALGVRIGSVALNFPPNGMATVEVTLMGKDVETDDVAYFVAPSPATDTSILAGTRGALYAGGASIAVVTGLNFTIEGGMETGEVIGSPTTPDVFAGRVRVSGQMTAYFENNDLYTKFVNEEETSLVFRLDGDPGESMMFKLPRIKLGGASKDDKETGGIVQTIPFTALLNVHGGAAEATEKTTIVIQDTTLV